MARFAHTVTVAALERSWFEEASGALVDLLDASREGPGGTVVLAAWWAVDRLPAALPRPARAPVSGRAVHRLAKARLALTRHPAEDGSR
ncbi:hypothetical protein [Streptomyces globisporus]